jgi:hypothetical protein
VQTHVVASDLVLTGTTRRPTYCWLPVDAGPMPLGGRDVEEVDRLDPPLAERHLCGGLKVVLTTVAMKWQ